MSETVHTTLRFSVDFHELVRIAIAKRRVRSFQQAVNAALEMWLGEVPKPVEPSAKHEDAEAERYLAFLREAKPEVVEIVRHILDQHARRRRARSRAQ